MFLAPRAIILSSSCLLFQFFSIVSSFITYSLLSSTVVLSIFLYCFSKKLENGSTQPEFTFNFSLLFQWGEGREQCPVVFPPFNFSLLFRPKDYTIYVNNSKTFNFSLLFPVPSRSWHQPQDTFQFFSIVSLTMATVFRQYVMPFNFSLLFQLERVDLVFHNLTLLSIFLYCFICCH